MKKAGKKLATTVLLTGTLLFSLTGCGASKDASTDAASEKEETGGKLKTLRIGTAGSDDDLLMDVGSLANDRGYFEEELNKVGYSVEFTGFTSTGPECNEAIASGDLDGAIYGDFPAFNSKSNGINTTIIASTDSNQAYGILTIDDNINNPKDLEGKKLICMQGTVVQYYWENYAEANNIDTSKVEIINSSDAASLLQTGDADAYVSVLSAVNYMESVGLGHVIEGGVAPENGGTKLVTLKTDIVNEHPEVAVAINKALIRGYEDAVADPEALYASLETATQSAEIQATQYEPDSTLSNLNPEITDKIIENYQKEVDWMKANGIITGDVELSTFVNQEFYQRAKDELDAE